MNLVIGQEGTLLGPFECARKAECARQGTLGEINSQKIMRIAKEIGVRDRE